MSDLNQTIKIKYNGEIRKLKDVTSYSDFLDSIKNKMKISPEKYELTYIDQDGDEISISTNEVSSSFNISGWNRLLPTTYYTL